jgi:hypothetical protein
MAEPEKWRESDANVAGAGRTAASESGERGKTCGARCGAALLCAGLVAGAIAWGLVELGHDTFKRETLPPAEGASVMNPLLDPATVEIARQTDLKNGLLSMALLGSSAGACLALAAALASGRFTAGKGIVAVGIGAVAGAAFGALGAYAAFTVRDVLPKQVDVSPTTLTYVAQGVAWGILGLGIGLAVSVSSPRAKVFAANAGVGALAGVLAALVYQAASALLLPAENTARIIPESMPARALWAVLSCAIIGLVLGALSTGKDRMRAAA